MDTQMLEDVLAGSLFRVADYQRPYAWEHKQLADLWDDIDLVGSGRHYTGTLVLQQTPELVTTDSGKQLHVVEVVDGQQRLTTCLILLDRLRRALRRHADDTASTAAREAAVDLGRLEAVRVDGVRYARLSLGASTDALFQDSVLGEASASAPSLNAGQQRLLDAATFFDQRIADLTGGDALPLERLLELRARVCYRLGFLVYLVEHSAEVGVLFETLNERGQPLTELEKVKNYLLYLARQLEGRKSELLAAQINAAWADIFANLAPRNLDEGALLRSHWLCSYNPKPREWQRVRSIKDRFPRFKYVANSGRLRGTTTEQDDREKLDDELLREVGAYVEELRRASTFHRELHDDRAEHVAFRSHQREARARSAALLSSGVLSPFRPLLFAARLKYPDDGEFFTRLLAACEIYSARVFAIAQSRSNAGESALAKAAHDLYSGKDREAVIDAVFAKAWQFAPDEVIRSNFDPAIAWYWRRSHKFVLYEYERSLRRDGVELPEIAVFGGNGSRTTEHVLPQNPEKGSRWLDDFDEHERRALTHSIGNLVLTYDNSAYSRFEYERKRGSFERADGVSYARSNLQSEQQIAREYPQWTPDAVRRRASAFADWALRRWPIAQREQTLTEDEEDESDVIDDVTDARDDTEETVR